MTDGQKLFSRIKTKQQGEEIIASLQLLHAQSKKLAFSKIHPATAKKIESLGKIQSYGQLLMEFEKAFFGAKVVNLTLAFYPTEGIIEKINDWFEENLGERVIIDLVVDPDIIGGVKVICNEKFRDLSIRTKLEDKGIISPIGEKEEQVSAAI